MESLFKEYKDTFRETEEEPKGRKEKTFGYSPFALQDAIGERSPKKAWIEYTRLRLSGISAEELIYRIIAKVRDITAIKRGADKKDLGIQKDFPYNKSKRDSRNWDEENIKSFYTKLMNIYHRSRMGGDELDAALEKTVLSI